MSQEKQDPVLDYRFAGKGGRIIVTVTLPDGTCRVDKLDVADARERKKFVDRLLTSCPEISAEKITAEIERIAVEAASPKGNPTAGNPAGDLVEGSADDADGADGGLQKTSLRDRLIELAHDGNIVELFHSPGREESVSYATISVGNHTETCRIDSRRFRWWVGGEFRRKTGSTPPTQALEEAIQAYMGIALHEGPERVVAIRVAEWKGDIWIDLANSGGEVVWISKFGIEVVPGDRCPVKFFRARGMQPLPSYRWSPTVSIHSLRSLINIGDDSQWTLLLGFMVACL